MTVRQAVVAVREATANDIPWLAGRAVEMAWETERRRLDHATVVAGIAAGVADPGKARYLVASLGDRPVGSLMLTSEWSDWRNGVWWWIQSVHVDVDQRRTGVYTALHGHVTALARATPGVVGLRLYVERDNAGALQAYTSLGMRDAGYVLWETEF